MLCGHQRGGRQDNDLSRRMRVEILEDRDSNVTQTVRKRTEKVIPIALAGGLPSRMQQNNVCIHGQRVSKTIKKEKHTQ